MKKRLYTEAEIAEEVRRLTKKRIIAIAVGSSLLALGAVAAVTCRAVRTMSEAKAWNDIDWNLDEDVTLL